MPRFSLRPILRRLSSKHSDRGGLADSTASDNSDTTAATSLSPSPHYAGEEKQLRPRTSISLAKLREKFANNPEPLPVELRSTSVSSFKSAPATASRTAAHDHQEASSFSYIKTRSGSDPASETIPEGNEEKSSQDTNEQLGLPESHRTTNSQPSSSITRADIDHSTTSSSPSIKRTPSPRSPPPPELKLNVDNSPENPQLVVQAATPEALGGGGSHFRDSLNLHHRPAFTKPASIDDSTAGVSYIPSPNPGLVFAASPATSVKDIHLPIRAESRGLSLVDSTNAKIVKRLIEAPATGTEALGTGGSTVDPPTAGLKDYFSPSVPDMAALLRRKIWVKRPGQSATLVQIQEDCLVDDVRDLILQKYRNSLGKTFDSPDMTLRILARSEHGALRTERTLGPDEEMCRTMDSYYPGGQTVDDALIIDVPTKRTPRPSPGGYRNSYHANEEFRPQENGTEYFPPMPAAIQPAMPHAVLRDLHHPAEHPRSISVLNTGQVPPLPSPGGRSRGHRAEREHRPKYGRTHTSSPNIVAHASAQPMINPTLPHRPSGRPRNESTASESHHVPNGIPAAAPPIPTPPAPDAPIGPKRLSQPSTPAAGAPVLTHEQRSARPKKSRRPTPDKVATTKRTSTPTADPYGTNPALPNVSSMLDATVPPINVLIVEDNIINLRILEGLMKRLKVRWQTAMNGQIAVDKWKGGGYHLVLMDIQMPIMNGLQATKEIRRLERVNGIGVFSQSTPGSPNGPDQGANGDKKSGQNDKLNKTDGLFKSPVIIVALTASSLQSDRHEALAAGCNDFLTKPVNFVWLERKVKEWGCMQALIDFDGWRKWKDYAAKEEEGKSEEQKQQEREKEEKQKRKMEKMALLQEKQRQKKEEDEKKKRRESGNLEGPPEVTAAQEAPTGTAG